MQILNIACNVLSWTAIIVGFGLSFGAMINSNNSEESDSDGNVWN